LTASRFRHCPHTRGLRHRLSPWAWVLVAVGAMLLLLLIFGGILTFKRNSKRGSLQTKTLATESDRSDQKGKDQINLIFKFLKRKSYNRLGHL
jgi:hypothetical protein